MAVLMVVGAALVPRLDIANKPRPEQGKTLTIAYGWPGAAAKVVEQNVTSRIEALVSAVKGVERVSSVSELGAGRVLVHLKPQADVSAVKFEVASLLRQVRSKLPRGVSYPVLSGGEVNASRGDADEVKLVLSYQMNGDMPDEQMRQMAEREVKLAVGHLEGVDHVEVVGGTSYYLEVAYDARELARYGITGADIAEAVKDCEGREDVVGSVTTQGGRVTVPLLLSAQGEALERMPLKTVDGKVVYLNNLATCGLRQRKPDSYFRVNGMNTIYINVYAAKDASVVRVASRVKRAMAGLSLDVSLNYDRAAEQLAEFHTLVWRSAATLAILLLFVWLASGRSWRYLAIIATALAANLLIGVVAYWLLDLRLHPVSMAGIAVSLGIIIDASIVMVDHYSYYRNRSAFLGILAAMLTTIGSLVVVFWLPDYLRRDLRDFAVVVMVNLGVALVVSLLFAPALVSQLRYSNRFVASPRRLRRVARLSRGYRRYIGLTQHRVWRWAMLAVAAGAFAGTLKLFVDCLDTNTFRPKEEEMRLHIRAQMPLGGSVNELNEKVRLVEAFLSQFQEVRRYEAAVGAWGAHITVWFRDEALRTGFPYLLENKVVGRIITIGGADWSTHGVSERGFSNSLNLQYRANSIEMAGYDYDRLYRYAEDMCRELGRNGRVMDIAIETPGHELQPDEFYVEYDHRALALDSVSPRAIHATLQSILSEVDAHTRRLPTLVRPKDAETFDLWQLRNAYLRVDGMDVRPSDFMHICRRTAKNCIPRENQEYVLRVAFNVLGSYTYTSRYIKQLTEKYNQLFPVGFRCISQTYGPYADEGTQYWLIGLIAVIIFFICAILFESLFQALVIVLLIPATFMGLFLTYALTGVPFGTGGFAAMVLLSGLTVNAGIYILCEYNQVLRASGHGENHQVPHASGHGENHQLFYSNHGESHQLRSYLRAFNHKVIPILLTGLSTLLGMVPFLIDGADDQPFWFSLAVGTIGGLAFSIVPLVVLLPLLLPLGRKINRQ